MGKRIYIETTVVSYLTARRGRDVLVAAHQEATFVSLERLKQIRRRRGTEPKSAQISVNQCPEDYFKASPVKASRAIQCANLLIWVRNIHPPKDKV